MPASLAAIDYIPQLIRPFSKPDIPESVFSGVFSEFWSTF